MRLLCSILLLACAGPVAADDAPSFPAWLTPYSGATTHDRALGSMMTSSYSTKAPPADVIEYYRGLFEAAGLTFHPVASGLGTTIGGAPPECSLEILIQKFGTGAAVEVSCRAWARQSSQLQGQTKFDQPVYPKARKPLPPLDWPPWLAVCDPDASAGIQNGSDQFKLRFLKVEFNTQQDREAILDYYAGLLSGHDYKVWVRSSALTPRNRPAVLEGAHYFDGNPGPRFTIHVQLTPVGSGQQVELRITAHPS